MRKMEKLDAQLFQPLTPPEAEKTAGGQLVPIKTIWLSQTGTVNGPDLDYF